MALIVTEYPQFFTATNLEWKKLLETDRHKDIIINSMRFLVTRKRVIIYGFVIMINHIHLIWQMKPGIKQSDVQRDFLKFTAQQIRKDIERSDPGLLLQLLVDAKDRKYQFWERNSLSIDLWSENTLKQKLQYIHENPVRAGVCQFPEEYKYSSAML